MAESVYQHVPSGESGRQYPRPIKTASLPDQRAMIQNKSLAQSGPHNAAKPAQLQDLRPQLNAPDSRTALPAQLKQGIESLSGMRLDHVRVQYNSTRPTQFNAPAYAQGADIHLATGQEKHLPHEAWHVVQQAQGRVQANTRIGGVAVNTHAGLEAEATAMGAKALSTSGVAQQTLTTPRLPQHNRQPMQRFANLNDAKQWLASRLPVFNATPLSKLRMQPYVEAFHSMIGDHHYNPAIWLKNMAEQQEMMEKIWPCAADLDLMENKLSTRIATMTVEHTRQVAESQAMQADHWLHTYATPEQRLRMAAIHGDMQPAALSLQMQIQKFNEMLSSIPQQTTLNSAAEFFTFRA